MNKPTPEGSRLGVLRAELFDDRATVVGLIEGAIEVADLYASATQPQVATGLLNGLALSLHHIYSAVEASFERIAKYLDQRVPGGAGWHAELLRQMSLEIPAVRPAFISSALRDRLDEYRRLRHVIRRSYEYNLEWSRMAAQVTGLSMLQDELTAAYRAFDDYLDALIKAL